MPSPAELQAPFLRLVEKATITNEARRRRLITLSVAAVVLALFGVALVQAALVQSQRDIDILNQRIVEVESQRARLARDVVVAESPEGIIARANEMGMVRAVDPVYLVAVRDIEVSGEGED